MNRVELMGRLTKNPELKYAQNENNTAVARYTLAVERRMKKDGQGQTADFVPCVAFGKAAEFVVKYYRKGMRVTVCGRVMTSSYTNGEGKKVYTTNIATDEHYFADGKATGNPEKESTVGVEVDTDGFMQLPEGTEEEIPFN